MKWIDVSNGWRCLLLALLRSSGYGTGAEMKILIEESVLRQALEALGNCEDMLPEYHQWLSDAQYELHTALDAAEKVEPVVRVWVGKVDGTDCRGIEFADMPEESAWNWMRLEDGEHDLYAHPAPAVPEGWQLVPKEPTREMFTSIVRHVQEKGLWSEEFSEAYKAMLQAAPKSGEVK